jgi:hypothetical protein
MARKCSICREKGHDKRQCPIKKKEDDEVLRIRRDRLNVLLPAVIASPYVTAFAWYQVSKDSVQLSKLNYAILAGDAVGLNIPEGATLGALIQKTTGAIDTLEGITKENLANVVADVTLQRQLQESGWRTGVAFSNLVEQIKFIFAEEYREPNGEESEGWSGFTGGSTQN